MPMVDNDMEERASLQDEQGVQMDGTDETRIEENNEKLATSTLVSDFVLQYEKALDARYLKEKEKDLKTKNTKPFLKTCYKIEAEAADIYTRKMFLKFQKELFSSQTYTASKVNEEGAKKRYLVENAENVGKEKRVYVVDLDISNRNAVCSCHMFEFAGILCRHIFAVFVKKSFTNHLPQKYVLPRWTINAKSHGVQENSGEMIHEDPQVASTLRRNNLIVSLLEVVEEGQKSQKKHDYLALALQKVHSELLHMDGEVDRSETPYDFTNKEQSEHNSQLLPSDHMSLLDPPHVSSKGRPKSLRQKRPIENQVGKKRTCSIPIENQVGKKRKCSICKETGHNKTSCTLQKRGSKENDLVSSSTIPDSLACQNGHEGQETMSFSPSPLPSML